MEEALKNWVETELRKNLGDINTYLLERKVPFAFLPKKLEEIQFAFGCGEDGVPVEDESLPTRYRYGRLVGRAYHISQNPALFSARGVDLRRAKLLTVVEHFFGLLSHRLNNFTEDLDELIENEPHAVDDSTPYSILDEPHYREIMAEKGSLNVARPLSGAELEDACEDSTLGDITGRAQGFDVIDSYEKEQRACRELGETYLDQERRAREEQAWKEQRNDAEWSAGFEEPSLDLGGFSSSAYNPLNSLVMRRKHDALYVAHAIITPGIDGTDNSIRTMADLLVSPRDEALLALYNLMKD